MNKRQTDKGNITTLLIIILALAAIGGTYFYLQKGSFEPIEKPAENSQASATTTKEVGFIKKAYVKNSKKYIDVDYITLRHQEGDMPWGTIVNDNPSVITIEVSDAPKIVAVSAYNNEKGELGESLYPEHEITWDTFRSVFDMPPNGNPWAITLKNNVVVEFSELYRP